MILAIVTGGTLRVFHRSDAGALSQVAQVQGAPVDHVAIATIVSDLENAFDWTPVAVAPPAKRALPKPKAKPKRARSTKEELRALENEIFLQLLGKPQTAGELASATGRSPNAIDSRLREMLADGRARRTEYEPRKYRYHVNEGGDGDGEVGADEPRDDVP